MAQSNCIGAPYLHPCTREQHSGVPAEFIVLLYEANILVRGLKGDATDGKQIRGEPRQVLTYFAF